MPLQKTLKYSMADVAQSLVGSLGPGTHKVLFESFESLAGIGFDTKCDFALPTIFLGFLLCPCTWGIFFGGIQLSSLRVVSSAYLRLLIFLLAILIPVYASSSPAFHMM